MFYIVDVIIGLFLIVGFFVAVSRLYHIKNHLQAINITSKRIYAAIGLMLLKETDQIECGTCSVCNRQVIIGISICPFCKRELDWSQWDAAYQKEDAIQV